MSLETVHKELMERVAPVLMSLETKEAVEVEQILQRFFQQYAYHSYERGWEACYFRISAAVPGPFRLSDGYSRPFDQDREFFFGTHLPKWGDSGVKEQIKHPRQIPDWLPAALAAAMHMDVKAAWPAWKRFGHWAIVSWRCPCCIQERKNRNYKMKLS